MAVTPTMAAKAETSLRRGGLGGLLSAQHGRARTHDARVANGVRHRRRQDSLQGGGGGADAALHARSARGEHRGAAARLGDEGGVRGGATRRVPAVGVDRVRRYNMVA